MVVPDEVISMESNAPGVTQRLEPLAHALENEFDMQEDDAHAIASVVAETFGKANEVDDDALDPDVRSIFYTLEAKKLLTFRREEYKSENGQTLRAYFWRLRMEEIQRIAQELGEDTGETGVYDQLPQDIWNQRNT